VRWPQPGRWPATGGCPRCARRCRSSNCPPCRSTGNSSAKRTVSRALPQVGAGVQIGDIGEVVRSTVEAGREQQFEASRHPLSRMELVKLSNTWPAPSSPGSSPGMPHRRSGSPRPGTRRSDPTHVAAPQRQRARLTGPAGEVVEDDGVRVRPLRQGVRERRQ